MASPSLRSSRKANVIVETLKIGTTVYHDVEASIAMLKMAIIWEHQTKLMGSRVVTVTITAVRLPCILLAES